MPLRETKIAPAFFIGLGGCGGAIVDDLARKVKQEESFERYQDLIHFFALDTDQDDLARLAWVDTAHKFILSDFTKPEYVELKQGKLHAQVDPLFSQWWPSWYRPRDARGKGAGQIRIESRLSLYHHFENDRAKILETFEKAIRRAYDVHNPFRANKAAKIYIYASLAGGTGSGGFAIMAYTVRGLLGGQRGHQLIGTFVLPNVFKSKGLPPNQFDKIMANGYSALSELELLQSARPQAPVEFHYDPDHPERAFVAQPPFDQIYLIEEKTESGAVIADPTQIYPAIADAAHAQIFSSIIDKEGSTLDNDTRELMQLDEQTFTKSFGSFGISALVLPGEDILEYCAHRMGHALLLSAVPGGAAALGDGTDIDSADEAFVRGLESKAEEKSADAENFRRIVEWVKGGGAHGGEGAVGAFIRRCKEDVQRRIASAIKLRPWEDAELAAFEKDPERVVSETAAAWEGLKTQITKSEDGSRARARQAGQEFEGSAGELSLSEIVKGKGPAETRYFLASIRSALIGAQEEVRKLYERGLTLGDVRLQDDFRRRVDELKAAAPETLWEKLPGRENDYFEVASAFCAWYREVIDNLGRRIQANAMLEFFAMVLKEIDRRRNSSFHFFARVDRVSRQLEQRAGELLIGGSGRRQGGDANRFVLDVEVLQDHRTQRRYWDHLYARLLRPSDFQLSGALAKLAEVAGSGGAELDIQRRVIDALIEMAGSALRGRIEGNRDERGLRIDEELEYEARLATAIRNLERSGKGPLPPPGDVAWADEMRRVPEENVRAYIKDKLEHAATKCDPFITLSVGAPLLPKKAYVVMNADYHLSLSGYLAHLAVHRVDKEQLIPSEDRHQIVFYAAFLGCPLHSVKSITEYEKRYFVVKQKELSEGAKVVGLPAGVPQIPLHQDKNWEGAPDTETRLFRISIEGVKENDSKLAYAERMAKRSERQGETVQTSDELRDFTLACAFSVIRHDKAGPAGEGFYLEDPDLLPEQRKLGRFRDQAFASYRSRVDMQKSWVRKKYAALLGELEAERNSAKIKEILNAYSAELERAVKTADSAGGKPVFDQAQKELDSLNMFRRERGY